MPPEASARRARLDRRAASIVLQTRAGANSNADHLRGPFISKDRIEFRYRAINHSNRAKLSDRNGCALLFLSVLYVLYLSMPEPVDDVLVSPLGCQFTKNKALQWEVTFLHRRLRALLHTRSHPGANARWPRVSDASKRIGCKCRRVAGCLWLAPGACSSIPWGGCNSPLKRFHTSGECMGSSHPDTMHRNFCWTALVAITRISLPHSGQGG
jgi:hypothetical protein